MSENTFNCCFLARIILEAETPLALASGEKDIYTDKLVLTGINGLPYIPGTSLTGVLSHSLSALDEGFPVNDFFGYQIPGKNEGFGSRVVISPAYMVGENGYVAEGLDTTHTDSDFFTLFRHLPVRQHVRINHRGVHEEKGKFDEEVVFKGTRFCFEIEMMGVLEDTSNWEKLLGIISSPLFRIGGGTRKGFGKMKIINSRSFTAVIDLEQNLDKYLGKSSSFNKSASWWEEWGSALDISVVSSPRNLSVYELKLTPEDFFLFGSGFGSDEADMTPVDEMVITWKDGNPEFIQEKWLIPASSFKGALAHRVAYHYNKLSGIFADKVNQEFVRKLIDKGFLNFSRKDFDSSKEKDLFNIIGPYNQAVNWLFGTAADEDQGVPGNVLFSDLFVEKGGESKLMNHVSIDRFTGGAMEGALFTEEVVEAGNIKPLKLDVVLDKTGLEKVIRKHPMIGGEYNEDRFREYFNNTIKALELALEDVCNGQLPLGGGTMRGHGCFKGDFKKVD